MATSSIEWTGKTWNPTTGCNKEGPGCKNCYAERMAKRLKKMGQPRYANEFKLTLHPETLDIPLHWRKPKDKPSYVFVDSMSDLFHPEVPLDFIQQVFGVMRRCPQHTFQVLTKRSERLRDLSPELLWSPNVWQGVSVENADYTSRIDHLRHIGAQTKFLSLEPLLGPLPNLNLDDIDWVIVGGESGPGARLMSADWVRDIRDQCVAGGVPFFFKQWGGVNKKKTGRILDGRTWDQMPDEAGMNATRIEV